MKYKNIKLRALEPEDLELLYEWENDDTYWSISNTASPFSRFTLKRYIENSHKNIFETGQQRFMIDHVEDNIAIGTIDVFDFDPFHKRAGIGILIANKSYRRKGYASMSLICLINYCFKTLQLHQVYCNILANNTGSINLFKKHGFVEIGIKKDWLLAEEGYVDEYVFQLINSKEA
jgi:diamine N-acetyltransferase